MVSNEGYIALGLRQCGLKATFDGPSYSRVCTYQWDMTPFVRTQDGRVSILDQSLYDKVEPLLLRLGKASDEYSNAHRVLNYEQSKETIERVANARNI